MRVDAAVCSSSLGDAFVVVGLAWSRLASLLQGASEKTRTLVLAIVREPLGDRAVSQPGQRVGAIRPPAHSRPPPAQTQPPPPSRRCGDESRFILAHHAGATGTQA